MKRFLAGVLLVALLLVGCSAPDGTSQTGGNGGGSVSVEVENKKNAFNSEKVLEKLETTGYTWSTKYDNGLALVIKNNSKYDCELNVNVTFKDAEGNLLGAKDDTVSAFGSGGEICLTFDNEEPFVSYEYEYEVSGLDYYEAVDSKLTCEASTAKDKAIVSVTNNGEKAADVMCTVLFFQGEKVVGSSWGVLGYDIEPGSKKTEEVHFFNDFDNIKVFLAGQADAE